mmetsp:Transcript_11601/g.18874  ORF Transcript_11601/g.18874 Transcript_11601/m.18874 type:complete len:116 (-) Transcript_11601:124-471(-)
MCTITHIECTIVVKLQYICQESPVNSSRCAVLCTDGQAGQTTKLDFESVFSSVDRSGPCDGPVTLEFGTCYLPGIHTGIHTLNACVMKRNGQEFRFSSIVVMSPVSSSRRALLCH